MSIPIQYYVLSNEANSTKDATPWLEVAVLREMVRFVASRKKPAEHLLDTGALLVVPGFDYPEIGRSAAFDFWHHAEPISRRVPQARRDLVPQVGYVSAFWADFAALAASTEEIAKPDPLVGYERYAEDNWDAYGADPISADTLQAARRFLNLLPSTLGSPDIAPGADGTIGLEWVFKDRPLRKLFIDIGPGGVWSGYWRKASGEKSILPVRQIDETTESVLAELFKDLSE